MRKIFQIAAMVVCGAVGSANATTAIGFQVEGGGNKQVYALNNGNFLSLWGFDNSEIINPGAGAVTLNSAQDLIDGFIGGRGGRDNIVAFYNGSNPINPGAAQFDPLTFGITVDDNARKMNSVWVEWTGGLLVYRQPNGTTASLTSDVISRIGDPLARVRTGSSTSTTPAPAVTPLPAAAWLLIGGLAGLFAMGRRRSA